MQHGFAVLHRQRLEGEFVIDNGNDQIACSSRRILFHHRHIAGVNAGLDHGITRHGEQDGARGMGHQPGIDGARIPTVGDGLG